MNRLVLMLSLLIGWAAPARSEFQTPVLVNGAEWLQPVDFKHFNWGEVSAVCDVPAGGMCKGRLGENDLTGWTWASAEEVAALFNFFIGRDEVEIAAARGPVHFFEKDKTWATAFFAAGFLPHKTAAADRYLAAYLRDAVSSPDVPEFRLFGGVSEYFRPYCSSVCNVAEINESWDFHNTTQPPALGYWFYRRSLSVAE